MPVVVSNNNGVVVWFTAVGKGEEADGLYCSRDGFRVSRPFNRAEWEVAFRAMLVHTQSHIGVPSAYAQLDL